MAKRLRPWQSQCVSQLVKSFDHGDKHFFCLAATATGKTFMAAEFAKRLIDDQSVDLILCFCPSNEIQSGIQETFEKHLGQTMDGSRQSVGSVHTYQSMLTQPGTFWSLFDHYRVLVIFDEIHHCAGTPFSRNNTWGTQILQLIANKSRYIVCLSGTPWRSDKLPITTAIYDHNQIQCDFSYGLADAVEDSVCRKPSIVLVDNESVHVETPHTGRQTFDSISDALRNSPLAYSSIIRDIKAQSVILRKAVKKLDHIREVNPQAGGVIVCSTIEHAEQTAEILRYDFHQSAVVVSYLHPNAAKAIKMFRHSTDQWIVSVGMVSEGTDIPRLQVCCHLSHVRTEMYFRQILGRILRITDAKNQEAWLYTFAEPNLCEFARRLQIDVPVTTVNFESIRDKETEDDFESHPNGSIQPSDDLQGDFSFVFSSDDESSQEDLPTFEGELGGRETFPEVAHFELHEERFIEQLVGLYGDDIVEETC